jgi:hypothetical protein
MHTWAPDGNVADVPEPSRRLLMNQRLILVFWQW